jgi:hypothetical protein
MGRVVVTALVFALIPLRSCSSFGTRGRLLLAVISSSRRQTRIATYSMINNTVADTIMTDESPSISSLIQRARKVRENISNNTMSSSSSRPSFILDPSALSYPSSTYNMQTDNNDGAVQRGYCNWLIPNTVMIGRYPGQTPETNRPTVDECQRHIQNMIQNANITLFCCLQTEVPSQDDDDGWKQQNGVYLSPKTLRDEFPYPFTRYGPLAQSYSTSEDNKISFIHQPIQDLGVPSSIDSLVSLLSKLLQHLEIKNNQPKVIYLHCWGGIGRAALVGSCLASLLYPELTANEILDWVQQGYDTRAGAMFVHPGLQQSPQTEHQRAFVQEFVGGVQTIARRL